MLKLFTLPAAAIAVSSAVVGFAANSYFMMAKDAALRDAYTENLKGIQEAYKESTQTSSKFVTDLVGKVTEARDGAKSAEAVAENARERASQAAATAEEAANKASDISEKDYDAIVSAITVDDKLVAKIATVPKIDQENLHRDIDIVKRDLPRFSQISLQQTSSPCPENTFGAVGAFWMQHTEMDRIAPLSKSTLDRAPGFSSNPDWGILYVRICVRR